MDKIWGFAFILLSWLTYASTLPVNSSAISSDECVCSTAGCAFAAVNILNSIDESVDPCDDFFEYACGTWIKNNPIPDDKSRYTQFHAVNEKVIGQVKGLLSDDSDLQNVSYPIEMAKQYYKACMDVDRLNEVATKDLYADLTNLGAIPVLSGSNWNCYGIDPTLLLAKVHKLHSSVPLFSMYTYADSQNTTRVIITLDQGETSLGSSTRNYFLKEEHKKIIDALRVFMKRVITKIGRDNKLELDDDVIDKDIDDLIKFETKIAEILKPEAERRNQTELYNLRTIKDLHELMPLIDWDLYLDTLLPEDVLEIITPDTEIIIKEIDYFSKLTQLLDDLDDCRVLTNYIFWRTFNGYINNLDEEIGDLNQDFMKVFTGRPEKPKRWKLCVGDTTSTLQMAVGSLYVKEHFDTNDRKEATSLIQYLRDTFNDMLQNVDWMDQQTKESAKEKADAIIPQIGYPDMAYDNDLLNEHYDNLTFGEGWSYYEIANAASQWSIKRNYRKLLKPYDRNEWAMSPATVNAYYSWARNQIVFPAAILQPPFFDGDYPKSINYGAIGFVIGHEITHGFDDQGRQFDKSGNLREWWKSDTAEKYKKKAQCIIDQYGNVVVNDEGSKINGVLTQGENIADNGGLKEAYLAYRKYIDSIGSEEPRLPGLSHIDHNKLFFISSAQFWCGDYRPEALIRQLLIDPHSPIKQRVNIPVANFPQFAEAFGCKKDSPLNPPQRCEVW